MPRLTADDWAIIKAMLQTVMAGLLLLYLLYVLVIDRSTISDQTVINLILILMNGGSGVSNLGKLRARNGST